MKSSDADRVFDPATDAPAVPGMEGYFGKLRVGNILKLPQRDGDEGPVEVLEVGPWHAIVRSLNTDRRYGLTCDKEQPGQLCVRPLTFVPSIGGES